MKALVGFLQVGLIIGGIVAAFNGQWLLLLAGLACAYAVGWLGNRATRAVEGISESGSDGIVALREAGRLLDEKNYRAALGSARGAVNMLKLSGDKDFLPLAYLTLAVSLAGLGDLDSTRRALSDLDAIAPRVRPEMQEDVEELRELAVALRHELDRHPFDETRFMTVYQDWNQA